MKCRGPKQQALVIRLNESLKGQVHSATARISLRPIQATLGKTLEPVSLMPLRNGAPD